MRCLCRCLRKENQYIKGLNLIASSIGCFKNLTKMTKYEAREILIEHLEWKRSPTDKEPPYKFEIVCAAIDCAIQALGDGWVRVEDRLPNDGQYVMAFTSSTIHSATSEIISEYSEKYGFTSAANITHWQPLPPKPKQP